MADLKYELVSMEGITLYETLAEALKAADELKDQRGIYIRRKSYLTQLRGSAGDKPNDD